MGKNLVNFQEKVLKILADKINDFYLGGGTALSLFYFQHRESRDLDFFSKDYNRKRISEIMSLISDQLRRKFGLIAEEQRKDRVKIAAYSLHLNKNESLKIDFIEDYLGFIKLPKAINGIKVLSLEDIYIRKIFALTGTIQAEDDIGRKTASGGRQETKDFYDLYCLSNTFMKLSKFAFMYCNRLTREGLVRWFRTYKRFEIKIGLLELDFKNGFDYLDMKRHFKKEINKILEKEVASL